MVRNRVLIFFAETHQGKKYTGLYREVRNRDASFFINTSITDAAAAGYLGTKFELYRDFFSRKEKARSVFFQLRIRVEGGISF